MSRGAGAPRDESLRSVDAQLARQLFAASLEVVEGDSSVVEGGVQVGALGQDRGLVGLGRVASTVVGAVTLLGPLRFPLELGLSFGLLVAVALELPEGGTPPGHACSDHPHVLRLVALATRPDLELDLLAGLEGAVATALDVRVMDEDVVLAVAGDEAVALLCVEELDGTDCHGDFAYLFCSSRSGVLRASIVQRRGYALAPPSARFVALRRWFPRSNGTQWPRSEEHTSELQSL